VCELAVELDSVAVRWDDAEWEPWRPEQAAERLAGVDVPWAIAAGWAIDLFVGLDRRDHEDLEVVVPASSFPEVARALAELEFFVVGQAVVEPVDEAGGLFDEHHQTWGLDRSANCWRIDVFREPAEGDTWICRRDERIRLPYSEVVEHTPNGIPFVRPEVVLLFKAKSARPKDEADLAAVLPRLDSTRRRRLHDWIALVHPGHFWLGDLER
jgi:hypothetical protein